MKSSLIVRKKERERERYICLVSAAHIVLTSGKSLTVGSVDTTSEEAVHWDWEDDRSLTWSTKRKRSQDDSDGQSVGEDTGSSLSSPHMLHWSVPQWATTSSHQNEDPPFPTQPSQTSQDSQMLLEEWFQELLGFGHVLRGVKSKDKAAAAQLAGFYGFLEDQSKFPVGHDRALHLANLLRNDVSSLLLI
jgi:hypothetical protein